MPSVHPWLPLAAHAASLAHLENLSRRGPKTEDDRTPRVWTAVSNARGDRVLDVIVVGAGPVGLWLAAELRRAAVDVLVLLDTPFPSETPKGSATFSARWVVGCDGPSSVVRKSVGISFLGTPPTMRLPIGDVRLANPRAAPALTLNRDNGINRELARTTGRREPRVPAISVRASTGWAPNA